MKTREEILEAIGGLQTIANRRSSIFNKKTKIKASAKVSVLKWVLDIKEE